MGGEGQRRLVKADALTVFRNGRKVLPVIPGIRIEIWKAFGLNLVLSAVVLGVALYCGFHFLLDPMEGWLEGKLPGWLDWTAWTIKFGLGLLLVVISLFLSILIPLNLMFLWYEGLVEKVVTFLGTPDLGVPIKSGILKQVKGGAREVAIIVGLFIGGFIPLIGPPLVFVLSSHFLGRATFDPYIEVMKKRGYNLEIPERRFGLTTIAVGAMEAGLPFYFPIFGLFLVPWMVIHLVIGLAYMYEKERLNRVGGPVH